MGILLLRPESWIPTEIPYFHEDLHHKFTLQKSTPIGGLQVDLLVCSTTCLAESTMMFGYDVVGFQVPDQASIYHSFHGFTKSAR